MTKPVLERTFVVVAVLSLTFTHRKIIDTKLFLLFQEKNLYNKIFGGFLMRQAFELAWANAALYW